ncbi:hypothetical protein Zmor_005323 [Zophobas morio]|uniref:Protein takeout n=1 Tax=Zophobas morio TaxID=2755281 RepID=A0AA38IV37_9CUCU|nr:hypothetical protein Zmor_005323 [Zophobas morio]
MKSFVLYVVVLVTLCEGISLPSSFRKCSRKERDFNQCLSLAINDAFTQLEKPLEDYGLPNLAHLEFPHNCKVAFGNSTDGLRQEFTKFTATGFSNPINTTASMDFGKNVLTLKVTYHQLLFRGEYIAQGRVFLLPVDIMTPVVITWDLPTYTFTFMLEEFMRETKYYKVVNSDIDMQPRNLAFHFEKLFDDQRLNDALNEAMSKKWLQIFTRLKYKEKVFAPFFGTFFNNFLERVPVSEIFG